MTPDSPSPNGLAARARREPIIDDFELAWNGTDRPRIEDFLPREPEESRGALFRELLTVELAVRRRRREEPARSDYAARFPEYAAVVAELFDQTSAHTPPRSDSRPSGTRFKAGDMIADRYRIVARLGRGGMGEVYQVEDETLQQTVALKFLPEERTTDPAWVERLKQEVTHARSVSHPHVCQVHDYQESQGQSFLVMAYAAGGSLLAQANMRPSGRFTPEDVNAYARQLCDGLTAVHELGIVHRDLKPGNVLLDDRGKVKIADFGLAALAERLRPEEAEQGTWQYMAPEQFDGGVPTPRSDLFALGLILYELLTGRRPYAARAPAEARERFRTAPTRPSEVIPGLDPAFDRAILWCLERDPTKRPASATEVKEALPPLSPKETADTGGTGMLRPSAALAILSAAVILILVNAVLARQTMAFHQLPPGQSSDWLRGQAAKLAASFNGADEPLVESSGFEWDLDLVRHAVRSRPAAWRPQPDTRSPLTYFWYRSSPDHHSPANRLAPTDPPLVTPGMTCVLLDSEGRLLEYHAVPKRKPEPSQARTREELRDAWEAKLLAASGLDPAKFRRVPPHRRPPSFADDVWGLEEVGGTGKQADIAVCGGRPVYFRVGEPFEDGADRPDRTEGENVTAQGQRRLGGGAGSIMMLLLVVGLSIPIAYRNWRLGRADLTGALRAVLLCAVALIGGWLLTVEHVTSLQTERVLLMNSLGVAVFWGAILFVCYLVVEPFMRRRWPERLSSWNRVLDGRLLDPLVGRDVLVGVAVGALATLPLKALAFAHGSYYLVAPVYEPLTPNVPLGLLLGLVAYALMRTAGTFVLMLLLGLVFRREWLALGMLVIVLAYTSVKSLVTYPQDSWVTWLGIGVISSIVAFTAMRFGWFATCVALFSAAVINIMPLTLAPQSWYAGATIATWLVLIALAGYGFFVSLGGQRLIPEDL